MKYILLSCFTLLVAAVLTACGGSRIGSTDKMPESGFLPNYTLLQPVQDMPQDVKLWRYRKAGLSPSQYTEVIVDPIALNQTEYSGAITPQIVDETKTILDQTIRAAIVNKGLKIVTQPGPKVVRVSLAITGAEVTNDNLKVWNFTPIGLATNAAAYAGGMNSKTPALVVENKITDSQSKDFIGGGVVTVQGESFRLESSSVKAFQDMAKRIVTLALEAPGK